MSLDIWFLDASATLSAGSDPPWSDRQVSERVTRLVCARYLDVIPHAVPLARRCKRCGSCEHGKPYLRDVARPLHLNVSHSGQWLAIGVGETEIGIDIEQIRPDVGWDRITDTVLAPSERTQPRDTLAWFRDWTIKESVVKLTGDGLSRPLSEVTCSTAGHDGWRRAFQGGAIGWVRELPAPLGYSAAVAVARDPNANFRVIWGDVAPRAGDRVGAATNAARTVLGVRVLETERHAPPVSS